MIIANSSSMLRSQISRLQELGKHEEAMAVLQRFLELEREAHATNLAESDAEPKSTIIAFPRLRPVS
jgi:hypothetical protein